MYKMISFSNNFIFIHINKTAGSSIEVALKDYGIKKPLIKEGNFPHSQHFKYDDYRDYIGDNFTNFYTFTVVRNPWDRVVSYYHNGAITKNLNFNNWVIDRYKNNNFLDHMRMYQPCTEWFDKVDKILRFESINKDFNDLCSELNLTCKLNHYNNTKHRRVYHEYYTEETKQIIYDYFIDDINSFNYKF